MEPLYFVMAILGCGESDAACREVQVVETRYQSEAECLAASDAELVRRDELPYPTIVAQCRPAASAPQLIRGTDVMLPDAGTLPSEPPRMAEARERREERPRR